MRIAVVHSFYTAGHPSGENNVVQLQLDQLRRMGHEVTLLARRTDEEERSSMYSLRAAATTLTGVGPSGSPVLREFRPDLVHVHNTFPNWGTRWLSPWRDRLVVTLHNFRPICAAHTLFRDGHACFDCLDRPVLPAVRHACYRDSKLRSVPLAVASSPRGALRSMARSAQRVIVLNDVARATYEPQLGRSVDVIPNFTPSALQRDTSKRGWVFVGRLADEKGVLPLLQAWPSTEPLDLIGDGPLGHEIRALTAGAPSITYVGMLSSDQLMARLGSYEGILLPSLWPEGLPTVLLEAMARGVPAAISHHVAAGPHLAEAGVAVMFDPRGGTAELSRSIQAIRQGGTSMRSRSIALHAREFSPQAWGSRIERLYEDVVARCSDEGSSGSRSRSR
jgi:glycosyltransferase involved in cell wall biosynthesis